MKFSIIFISCILAICTAWSDEVMRLHVEVSNLNPASSMKGRIEIARRKFLQEKPSDKQRRLFGVDELKSNGRFQISEISVRFPKKTIRISPSKLLDLCNPDFTERWGLRDEASGVYAVFNDEGTSVLISIDGGHPADRYSAIFSVKNTGEVTRYVDNKVP